MASFKGAIDSDLIKMFEQLEKNTPQMLADMVKAGAEVVAGNVNNKMPRALKNALTQPVKITKPYKTPTDNATNCQVCISGYFVNRYKQVVPAPLVANIFEYGRSGAPYPKKPFFRACFSDKNIEKAMLEAQKKYIKEG